MFYMDDQDSIGRFKLIKLKLHYKTYKKLCRNHYKVQLNLLLTLQTLLINIAPMVCNIFTIIESHQPKEPF